VTNQERVILLKTKLTNLKQAGYMQKVGAAEMLIEDAVFLLESISQEVQAINKKIEGEP